MEAEPGDVGQQHKAGRHEQLPEVLEVDAPTLVTLLKRLVRRTIDIGIGIDEAGQEESDEGDGGGLFENKKSIGTTEGRGCGRGETPCPPICYFPRPPSPTSPSGLCVRLSFLLIWSVNLALW